MPSATTASMQPLWRGETVTHERFWNIREARICPVPAEPVEVWIGAQASAAINRTARMAQGWLASPGLGLAEASDRLNEYRQACAEHHRPPTAVAIRRDIYIGADSQRAEQFKQKAISKGYRGIPEEALMAGSVTEVADEVAALEEAGYTDIIVRNMHTDQAEALATIERLAEVKTQLQL